MLLPVIVSAWYGGLGPGLAATVLCSAATIPTGFPFWRAGWWQLGVFAAQGTFVAVLVAARDRASAALASANEKVR